MVTLREAMGQGRSLVFGHRGAKAYAPMNTLPAYQLALDMGADGIELDVHRSKDGHAVIVHDFTVDATTNGEGRVADFTLDELKALDAGSWFGAAFAGVQIPTLDEVFEAFGTRLLVNVEIKSETQETDGVEQVVADVIRKYGMQERVIVSSFNPLALARFREFLPDVAIGYLYEPGSVDYTRAMMDTLNLDYEAEHPYEAMIDAAFVEQAQGRWINTWTVNDPGRARTLAQLGVNAIITDRPDAILEALTDRS